MIVKFLHGACAWLDCSARLYREAVSCNSPHWATDISSRNSSLWEGCNMKLPHRRHFLHLAAGAAALPAVLRIARAQPSSEVSKKGTRVITLGTKNGPFPTVGRAQSSNLLVVNAAQYVIDAGEGVTRRLARLGTNFRNIDNIFITHPHSDHTGGLGGLMTAVYDSSRTALVNIYGPPGTAASVKGLLEFLTVSSEI